MSFESDLLRVSADSAEEHGCDKLAEKLRKMAESYDSLKWYRFGQNNSGGSFSGATEVWIQAPNADEANGIAETETDIYFDGISAGLDCSCCGDRLGS